MEEELRLLPALVHASQNGSLVSLGKQPKAAALCLPGLMSILDRSIIDPHPPAPADSSSALSAVMAALLQQVASRQQACDQLLPLLCKWLSQRMMAQQHAAALQPTVLLAALARAGLRGYMSGLHPALMDCALARPEGSVGADDSIWQLTMQVMGIL